MDLSGAGENLALNKPAYQSSNYYTPGSRAPSAVGETILQSLWNTVQNPQRNEV